MKHADRSSALRWLFARTRGQYIRLIYLVLSNAVVALTSVGYALACKGIIDAAVSGDAGGIRLHIALILGLLVLDLALTVSRRVIAEIVSTQLHLQTQRYIVQLLVSRDFSSIADFHSGELLNRLFSDVSIITGGITGILPSLTYMIARLIGAAAALFALSPRFTLLFIIVGLVIFLTMTLLRDPIKQLHKNLQHADGQTRSFMQEILERLLVIKVFGAARPVADKLRVLQDQYARCQMRSHVMGIASGTGFGLIFDVGHILALVWGCFGILQKTTSYGTLTAMLQLVGQVQQPFNSFSGILSQIYTVTASAERLMELEALPVEPEQETISYADLTAMRLDHVDFTYGRSAVLQDASVTIRKGDMVSVSGVSGGGKSTLFLLLLGAYRPTSGEVSFDLTAPVRSLAPGDATRRLCAYVPQGNHLLSGTLRENLTFFREDVSDERIHEALTLACAAEFVRDLPRQLDTPLGEKGHGLSEGQMQRIAIARALLSDAPILLLDEATSALDEATEAQLLQNIAALKNRTCLIVTHRRSALAICNRHLVIRNSQLTEQEAGAVENV